MTVAVIGGGIAGLAAAWQLAEAGADVLVLEAADRVGGKLRSESLAGVTLDVGAESMLARRPEGIALAEAAGLSVLHPQTTAAGVFVRGSVQPLPPRTIMGIPSDPAAVVPTLSQQAAERIAAEPALDPLPPLTQDVAVGPLVRERFGDEVVDSLVEPMLGGVYAGRVDDLSLGSTIPALADALRTGGSLLRATERLAAPVRSGGPVFVSVEGGLAALPAALASSGRFRVRTGTTVRELARTADGFRLTFGPVPAPEVLQADAVVVAVPAAKAALLLRQVAPRAATALRAVTSASLAIVSLAYRDADLPGGSGLLVGAAQGRAVKGVTLTSQKWPGFPGGLQFLRASVGRAGSTHDLQREDADLLRVVRRDLRTLIGLTAEPVDSMVTRWGGGLPQYAVGHAALVADVRAAVAEVPGLAVCGATYDGVGVPACIASARAAVAALGPRVR